MKRIAINGFGRIGRLVFRNLWDQQDVEVVAINDLTDSPTLAHLLKYDTAQGTWQREVQSKEDHLMVDQKVIPTLSQKNPGDLPWKELEVDVVLECTGVFRTKDKAEMHLEAGAKKVLLSAPPKDNHFTTIVLGINENQISQEISLYSNASCTTNCLAPLVKVINEELGFVQGMMTTIHAYTADQRLQDAPHRDLRRARAAAQNMVPTSTGAAEAVQKVYPQIRGKLLATSVRVPIITGSIVDLTCTIEKFISTEEINQIFKNAALGPYNRLIQYMEAPIVSSDIIGNKHSAIFDAELTEVMGKMIKVVAWYDNEGGYAARLADMARMI